MAIVVLTLLGSAVSRGQEIVVRFEAKRVDSLSFFEDASTQFAVTRFSVGLPPFLKSHAGGIRNPRFAELPDDATRSIVVVWGQGKQGDDTVWCVGRQRGVLVPCKTMHLSPARDGKPRFEVECRFLLTNLPRQQVRTRVSMELKLNAETGLLLFRNLDFRVGRFAHGGSALRIGLMREPRSLTFRRSAGTGILVAQNGSGKFRIQSVLDSTGTFRPRECYRSDGPVLLGGKTYEVVKIAADGSGLVLRPSSHDIFCGLRFRMPDLTFTMLDGERTAMSAFTGKMIVLSWWSIQCQPCIVEMPGLNTLVDTYEGNNEIVFVAVSPDERERQKEFLGSHELDFTLAQSTPETEAILGSTFPRNLIIDRTGIVVYDELGGSEEKYRELDAVIAAELRKH